MYFVVAVVCLVVEKHYFLVLYYSQRYIRIFRQWMWNAEMRYIIWQERGGFLVLKDNIQKLC
jgi:hypothetical protein